MSSLRATQLRVLKSSVYEFPVHDLKASLSVWRERRKEYSWIQEEEASLFMHPQYFLYPSMIQKKKRKKRCVFPSQRINTNCTAEGRGVGVGNLSGLGKSFPSFQPSQKPTRTFDPHNHWGAHVCFTGRVSVRHRTHTFQHIEQAHTSLPASPNSASEGA